jgi:hypothetical protein
MMMQRDAAKFWLGVDLPKEIAYLWKYEGMPGRAPRNPVYYNNTNWIIVTYKEIIDAKSAKQLHRLEVKRSANKTVPCYIWVFYNPYFPYSGWWIYIKTNKKDYSLIFGGYNKELIIKCMELFPCGIIPVIENLEVWMIMFSKVFPHIGFKRKKQGLKIAHCVLDQNKDIIDIIP